MKVEGIAQALVGGVMIGFSASIGYILAKKLFKEDCKCGSKEEGTSNYSGVIPRTTGGWESNESRATSFGDGQNLYRYTTD